jgi:hypothetical protein
LSILNNPLPKLSLIIKIAFKHFQIVLAGKSGDEIDQEGHQYEGSNTSWGKTGIDFTILGYRRILFQLALPIQSFSIIYCPHCSSCQAVFDVMKDEFLEEWLAIAAGFEDVWQLPRCVGADDGKHFCILHPRNSGSVFYNYKGYHSIVLMAVVDANYNFIFADVGCQGRISDSGVMRNTLFWSKLVNGKPKPKPLPSSPSLFHPDSNSPIPYFFVGHDAFPLETKTYF